MISVAQACGEPGAVRFRRSLDAVLRVSWLELAAVMDSTQLGVGADSVRWNLEPSGVFSVKSMYAKLSQGASRLLTSRMCGMPSFLSKLKSLPGNWSSIDCRRDRLLLPGLAHPQGDVHFVMR
jgi:hypothetical protein